MHALRVNEVKLTSRNGFVVNLFELESESEWKHDEKTFWRKNFLLGHPAKSLPVF